MLVHLRDQSDEGAGVSAREQQVRRFVDEVWNQRNYDAVADLYSERYVAPNGTGPTAKAEMIQRYHQSFPDLQMEIDELIVGADDIVVARLTLRGTDLGGYAGRPPTGRATREWVVNILHFEDDRVVREWIGADKLGLFIDLGAVADPWPA
jgi:predicted ester cyclase